MKQTEVVSWDRIDMAPSLPDSNWCNLVYGWPRHYCLDNEAYHIGQSIVTKAQVVALMEHILRSSGKTLGAKTIMFPLDLEESLSRKPIQGPNTSEASLSKPCHP